MGGSAAVGGATGAGSDAAREVEEATEDALIKDELDAADAEDADGMNRGGPSHVGSHASPDGA